ncbi:hypothetical protein [Rhizobium terrae]|uniref:hypothetical protein n=1 Tax=Rhizobium terrae TaxID=2171756 RepID=UPI000E3B58B5|nr:hypothetical protein [Rhizobium terrae]
MAKDDIFEFDLRGFTKDMTKIEKTILPTAQAGFLNGIAFGARKSLLKHADATIQGKPTAWTKRGFVVDKATPGSLEATVRIQPLQAGYMTLLINGGTRKAGDVGATPFDVLTDAPDSEKNAFGNLKRGYLKRIARQAVQRRRSAPGSRRNATSCAPLASPRLPRVGRRTTRLESLASSSVRSMARKDTGSALRSVTATTSSRYSLGCRRLRRTSRRSGGTTISASIKDSDPAKLYQAEITRALRKLNGG